MPSMEYFDGGQWVQLTTCLPATPMPVSSGLDWKNANQQGYRLGHYTAPGDGLGTFYLGSLSYIQNEENSGYHSERLLTYNLNNDEAFSFHKNIT